MMKSKQFILSICITVCSFNLSAQGMVDRASEFGLFGLPSTFYASGVSFVDFDLDGDDDITLGSGNDLPILFFENKNGSFEQLSLVNELAQIMQVTWVDYDNDGDLDFSYNSTDGMKLHENIGGFQFQEATDNLNLEDIDCEGYPICWADFDKDGDLDFFLTQFCFPNAGVLQYYKNNGDKTFSYSNNEAGVDEDWAEYAIAGSVLDFNNDGWEDFYMTIDFRYGNVLLKNNGDGTFSNVSAETGADLEMDGMSSTIGDIDLDGDMDIYVTNSFYGDLPDEENKLLVNDGQGGFVENADSWGVIVDSWSWGAQFLDVDSDFDLDLVVNAEGSDNQGTRLFINELDVQTFRDDEEGLSFKGDDFSAGYGLAVGDFNEDGYPDLFENTYGTDVYLLKNNWNDSHWLKVKLTGVESNKMGIGTRLECYVDGKKIVRHVRCGEGYISQNSYTQFFGLRNESHVDSLILRWPLGTIDKYYNLEVNSVVQCIEGQELVVDLGYNGFWKNASCQQGDSDLIVSLQGGALPYTYQIQALDGSVILTGDLATSIERDTVNLPRAEYVIVITDDDMNMVVESIYSIPADDTPIISSLNAALNCPGELPEITADINGGKTPFEYMWNTGETEESILSGAGPYGLTVTDDNGCSTSIEGIDLGIPDDNLLNYLIQVNPASSSFLADGSFLVTGVNGFPPYNYTLYDDQGGVVGNSSVVGNLFAGDYVVEIIDANDCLIAAEFTVDVVSSIQHFLRQDLKLFPNPTQDVLNISFDEVFNGTIHIEDAQGKYLKAIQNESNQLSIDVSDLIDGVYFLVFKSNESMGMGSRNFVISR